QSWAGSCCPSFAWTLCRAPAAFATPPSRGRSTRRRPRSGESVVSGSLCLRLLFSNDGQSDANGSHHQGHAGDVQNRGAQLERVNFLLQFAARLFQFLIGFGASLFEFLDLFLLFARENVPLALLFLALEFAQLVVGFVRLLLQLGDLGLVTLIRPSLHFLHHREWPIQSPPAAHANQVLVAGKLFDNILR